VSDGSGVSGVGVGLADGIAVVGMSGRFPGADNVERFWANVRDGVECISRFGPDELRSVGVDPGVLDLPNYVNAGATLRDIDLFDARFFGFSPRDAELLDPQHRLFLECAWEGLEHAGCFGHELGRCAEVMSRHATGDQIKGGILIRELFGRMFPGLDLQPTFPGRFLCALQHGRSNIRESDMMPEAGKINPRVAAARGNIQHLRTRRELNGLHGFLHVLNVFEDMPRAIPMALLGELISGGLLGFV